MQSHVLRHPVQPFEAFFFFILLFFLSEGMHFSPIIPPSFISFSSCLPHERARPHSSNTMFPRGPINSCTLQLQNQRHHQNLNKIRQQLRQSRGTLESWAAIRPTFSLPFPSQRVRGTSLARSTLSADAHTYPGSSIFHPGLGNIDIGRRAADIGDVMTQLNLEAFLLLLASEVSTPTFLTLLYRTLPPLF